ncbi:hypothetical protein IG631_01491 [Alternaria alternata]|nr:hypothetical protein IG631_01491 [Alternaria alternata]
MENLQAAIDTLRTASEHDLQALLAEHGQTRIQQAIRRLQTVIPKSTVDPSKDLSNQLDQKHGDIHKFFTQSPKDAVGTPPENEIDFRLMDIWMVEGKRTKTLQDQFRRFLAERSLALQFDQFNPRKLQSMIKNHTFNVPKGRNASSRSFARRLSTQHVEVVLQAVHVGLRYLLLEKICGSAISWVLGFFRKEVKCMKFSSVREAISYYVGFEERENFHEWMQEVLELYDSQNQRTPRVQDDSGRAWKRQKTSKDSKSNPAEKLHISNHTASNYVRMRDCRFV